MKKLLAILLLAPQLLMAADVKISQLPVGSAASGGSTSSVPYYDQPSGTTKQMQFVDFPNIPSLGSTYAPLANPTFSGFTQAGGTSITRTLVPTLSSAITSVNLGTDAIIGYAVAPTLSGYRSAGTEAAPTGISSGSTLLSMSGRAYDGTTWSSTQATISLNALNAWSVSDHSTQIRFSTTPSGSTTMVERMRLQDSGHLSIGTTTDNGFLLDIQGTLNASGNTTVGGTLGITGQGTFSNSAAAQILATGWSSATGAAAGAGQINLGNSGTGQGRLMYDNSGHSGLNIDNTLDDAAAVINLRLRNSGTPVTPFSCTGTACTITGTETVSSTVTINSTADNANAVTGGSFTTLGGIGVKKSISYQGKIFGGNATNDRRVQLWDDGTSAFLDATYGSTGGHSLHVQISDSDAIVVDTSLTATFFGTQDSTSATTGNIISNGGLGIAKNFFVGGSTAPYGTIFHANNAGGKVNYLRLSTDGLSTGDGLYTQIFATGSSVEIGKFGVSFSGGIASWSVENLYNSGAATNVPFSVSPTGATVTGFSATSDIAIGGAGNTIPKLALTKCNAPANAVAAPNGSTGTSTYAFGSHNGLLMMSDQNTGHAAAFMVTGAGVVNAAFSDPTSTWSVAAPGAGDGKIHITGSGTWTITNETGSALSIEACIIELP